MGATFNPIDGLNTALEGRYRIEREIGEGGMATVYLAEDLKHHRRVALKVLKPELAAVVGAERFLAEIETTANLTHPHILPLHDSGEADGSVYFVMPYIEGETLRDKIDRENQLGVEEARAITRKVATALDYAHEQGVVHRDIKPGNILLSERGEPMVADFGVALAVAHAGGDRFTETGLRLGTPHYMSPEQATGDRDVSPRSDVFALGCILHEMLVGEPPYTGPNAQAVLGRMITGVAEPVAKRRPSVPRNVDAAIRKALEKLPADRFKGAGDFADALDDPGFRHGGETRSAWAGERSWWMPVAVAAGTLALALALGLGWLLLRGESPDSVTRFELGLPDGLRVYIPEGVNLDISPDGSQVVFVGEEPGSGGRQLWLRSLDRLEPTPLDGTADARSPRFSPDGRGIGYLAESGLHAVSLSGASPRTLVSDSVQEGSGGLAWSADGYLYYRKLGQGIWRVPEAGGEPERVTTLGDDEGGHAWPDVLPDGDALLYTRDLGAPADDVIALRSLETGETRTLFQGAMARFSPSGHLLFTTDNDILAVPFSPDRLQVSGTAELVLEGVQVNIGSASFFSVSSSGTLIYLPATTDVVGTMPFVVRRDGSAEPLDVELRGMLAHPAVSPAGRRVAFDVRPAATRVGDVWIYDREVGTFSRFTFEGGSRPFWSPDGQHVGFISRRSGADRIFVRPADASAPPRQTRTRAGDNPIWDALWTPDGEGIVYATTRSGNDSDIVYAPLDRADDPVAILDRPYNEGMPSLSPDGRLMAYTSDQSGREEVYVRPFPGGGGDTQISIEGGTAPVWSREGDELFYYGPDNRSIVSVSVVSGQSSISVASRAYLGAYRNELQGILSGAAQYDVFPGGEELLVMRNVAVSPESESAVPSIAVVQNFLDELGRVVPE